MCFLIHALEDKPHKYLWEEWEQKILWNGGIVPIPLEPSDAILYFPLHVIYHRIIEWQGLEETLKIIRFQPPCHEQGHLALDQVAQSSIQPGLEHCQGGGIHSFSVQPVPVPHHPQGEEFLPNI